MLKISFSYLTWDKQEFFRKGFVFPTHQLSLTLGAVLIIAISIFSPLTTVNNLCFLYSIYTNTHRSPSTTMVSMQRVFFFVKSTTGLGHKLVFAQKTATKNAEQLLGTNWKALKLGLVA